jgi:hypothetical protein
MGKTQQRILDALRRPLKESTTRHRKPLKLAIRIVIDFASGAHKRG